MESWDDHLDERISYRDSDQFDEDSLSACSWFSENENVGGLKWVGWKRTGSGPGSQHEQRCQVSKLLDISAKVVAAYFPFQAVEEYQPPVPEQVQMKVAYWSFPQNEDNIQLYSCIAHGTMDDFQVAEFILKHDNVKEVFQIGFHLTGMVLPSKLKTDEYKVTVLFDRCQIISCSCSCHPSATWCSHVIALCLFRIRFPDQVNFRAPISESLSRLQREQLQKFTQYLINELAPQVLPTAQRLLDELLMAPFSQMNKVHGAPDPTAGAGYVDQPKWRLDEEKLHENIRKILCKFCGPSPVAFVDFNSTFFASSAPTTSIEWLNILHPLMSREPEGLWNLLDIVRNLFRVNDANSAEILQIITEECLNFHQFSLWWFASATEDASHNFHTTTTTLQNHSTANVLMCSANVSTSDFARNAGARLLDECVNLWKVALMSPEMNEDERKRIKDKLESWQTGVLEKAKKGFNRQHDQFTAALAKFSGFKPAIEVARKDWKKFLLNFGIDLGNFNAVDPGTCIGRSLHGTLESKDVSLEDIEDLYTCIHALNALGISSSKRLAVTLATKLLSISNSDYDRFSVAIKSAYLCHVLKDTVDSQYLGFKLAVLGLAFPRKPAATKSQEVKLTHCEINLRSALKLMTIGEKEVNLIKSCIRYIGNTIDNREPRSKPFIFSIYALEILTSATVHSRILKGHENKFAVGFTPSDNDKKLAYQFSISSLGWNHYGSKQLHSMLCESSRRFRNDLAITLLLHFKNDTTKLNEILSVLLNEHSGTMAAKANPKTVNNLLTSQISNGLLFPMSKEKIDGHNDDEKHSKLVLEDKNVSKQVDADLWKPNMDLLSENWDEEILRSSRDEKSTSRLASPAMKQEAFGERFKIMVSCRASTLPPVGSPYCSPVDRSSLVAESFPKDVPENSISDRSRVLAPIRSEVELDESDFNQQKTETEEETEVNLHKKQEFSASLGSLDGKNNWDPALSWAERCELHESRNHRPNQSFKGSEKNGLSNEARETIDNFHLECDAYALFELAKDTISQASEHVASYGLEANKSPGSHRNLQLASFELAIFSLGMQNRISPKWLSRTYSPHVTWIADKSIDIGCEALQILNEKWENVLTPSEVIDIAARASRCVDNLLKRAGAELAVSCLPLAHTLNPGEIQQSMNMCKEQDVDMLERACVSVETASRKGGIQPEILFFVARQWQHIHQQFMERNGRKGPSKREKMSLSNSSRISSIGDSFQVSGTFQCGSTFKTSCEPKDTGSVIPSVKSADDSVRASLVTGSLYPATSSAHNMQLNNTILSDASVLTAEKFVEQQMHRMAQEMLKRSIPHQGIPEVRSADEPLKRPQYSGVQHHHFTICNNSIESSDSYPKLQNAFRIGMKALEALSRRGIDERSEIKYAPSPPCSDDIRWLCALAASLGPQYLRNFCSIVISSVSSPYVLHDLALESARHFAMYNPAQLASHLQSLPVSPIVLKCLTMYSELVRHDLILLNQTGYPDFVELLRRARSAFCMAPGGMRKFNELLEMIRKTSPKKRDLWQHLMNGLSRA